MLIAVYSLKYKIVETNELHVWRCLAVFLGNIHTCSSFNYFVINIWFIAKSESLE